jgi:hypothetical protein
MKLSDAIREGAKEVKQGFGSYFYKQGQTQYACALGAASLGLAAVMKETIDPETYSFIPEFETPRRTSRCPVPDCLGYCSNHNCQVDDLVIHLNDEHEWTFDQIADWIDCLEPETQPELPPKEAPVPTPEEEPQEVAG